MQIASCLFWKIIFDNVDVLHCDTCVYQVLEDMLWFHNSCRSCLWLPFFYDFIILVTIEHLLYGDQE
jgi:hypothetical protein